MQSKPISRRPLGSAIAIVASLLAADVALAQQTVEEIVVTARKREENLQDVPMAIAAFSADQLTRSQVDNITDLQKMTPNITINETSGLTAGAVQVFIRGIGNDPGFDQGVGIYLDDVYLNTATGSLLEVYDIERIEVLKGPQGNLYGRNTIGGAIKYVTREPGEELQGGLEAQVGSDDLVLVKGNVSGPLVQDQLFGGAAFMVRQRDGYQTNAYDGSDWAEADVQAYRGNLLWRPAESLSVKLVGDYSNDESRPSIPTRVAVNAPAIQTVSGRLTGANAVYGAGTAILDTASDVSLPADEFTVNTAFIDPGFEDFSLETSSLAGTISWELNEALTLKSVTAWRDVEYDRPFDYDGSAQQFIQTLNFLQQEDFSQELQLNFDSDTVHAVVGAYYLDSAFSVPEPGTTLQTTRLRFYSDHFKSTYRDDRNLESVSAYATVEWDFAEDWQLSLGGRYTEDEKDQDIRGTVTETFYPFALTRTPTGVDILGIRAGAEAFVETQPQFLGWFNNQLAQTLINNGFPSTPPLTSAQIKRVTSATYQESLVADDKWNEFSPSIRLTHFVNEDLMLYGGFASGFKAGGFATSGNQVLSYDPEIVETYSLGLKSELLEGTMRINGELFFNDYQDKQLSTIYIAPNGALVSTQDNVGKVESWGGELELTWMTPIEGLSANLNAGYLDSEIKEYLQAVAGGGSVDVSDRFELGFSPEWTAQGKLTYEFDVGAAGSMLLGADVAYRDEMYTDSPIDVTNAFRARALSDALTTYNAVIAFTTADEAWRVALEGRNLSDEVELVNTFTVSNYMTGGYTRERTWAFSVAYDF